MQLRLIIIFFSFCFSISSNDILETLGLDLDWNFIDFEDDLSFYSYKDKEKNIKLIKIEKEIEEDNDDIFNIIKGIQNYNNVISNQSLYTKLVKLNQDTLWGYQLVQNSIPFTRDREYIFKMYQLHPDKLVWTIDNGFIENDSNSEDVKNLKVGAGLWEIKYNGNKKFLINKIYVDDELNIPGLFIDKLRIKHVAQIFKDVIIAAKNKYGDLK